MADHDVSKHLEVVGDHSFTSLRPSKQSPSPATQAKLAAIRSALDANDRSRLIDLALSADGLVCDELRREAWPRLLNFDPSSMSLEHRPDWHDLPPHRDESQVALDVNRSFIYYPSPSLPPPPPSGSPLTC